MILTFTHGASKFFNNLDQFLGGDISIFININQVESLKLNILVISCCFHKKMKESDLVITRKI